MKPAFFADSHLRGHDLDHSIPTLNQALTRACAKGATHVLFAGDLVDRAQVLDRHAFAQTILVPFLAEVERAGLPWLMIAGNHDLCKPGEKTALNLLAFHPLIRAFERPGLWTERGMAVACLPWPHRSHWLSAEQIRDLDSESRARAWAEACRGVLAYLKKQLRNYSPEYSILLGHCEVAGAVTPHGYMLAGESFPFSCLDLDEMGCDLIALGHYHKRQRIPLVRGEAHYIGALRQLNHGEEGNPAGFLMVDTETRELEWVDLDEPRRYYTVEAIPEVTRHQDVYKVRSATAPAELPPNSTWEAVTTPKQAADRTGGNLDPTASLGSLLAAWSSLNLNGTPILDPALVALAGELESRVGPASGGHRGSLTAIHRIRISGIIPYEGTLDVELAGHSWVAICGKNGAGKSTLTEAIVACLYGVWPQPSRGNDLYGAMWPEAEEARIEVEFEAGGQGYRASRTLKRSGKTQAQSALLSTLAGKPIAGPKVRDYEAEVERLVGSLDYLLATVFLAQERRGDLVDAGTTERQEFMQDYLRLQRWPALAEAAKAEGDSLAGRVSELERQGTVPPDLGPLYENVAEFEMGVEDEEGKLRILEAQLQVARDEYSRLDGLQQQRVRLAHNVDRAQGELEAVNARIRELTARERALQARLAEEAQLQQDVARLEGARYAHDRIKSQDAAIQLWSAERRRLQQAVAHAQAALVRAEERVTDRKAALERDTRTLEKERERHRLQRERVEDVGCAAQGFLSCKLLDGVRADLGDTAYLDDLQADLDRRQVALDLVALEGHPEAAALVTAQQALADHPDAPAEPEVTLAEAEKLVRELEGKATRLAQLGEVRKQLETLSDDIRRTIAEDGAQASIKLQEAKAAFSAAEDLTERLAEKRTEGQALAGKVEDQKQSVATVNRSLGAARRELEQAQEQAAGALERAAEVEALRTRQGHFRVLQQACGRDGIPQLLVSAALPALQELLDQVCSIDFGGRFSVRLDTVRVTKTAGSREGFEVVFCRRGLETDARKCSPGEKATVRAALRCALVAYQAAQAAESYRVVVLDEPATSQDVENADATLAAMQRLLGGGRFEQVLIISHSEEQLAGIPHHVVLEQGLRGTRVAGQRELVEV